MNKAMLRKLLNFIFSAKLYSSSQGQHMQRNKLMLYASIFPFSCWVELPVFQKIGDLKWEKVFTDFEFKRGNTKLFMIPRQQVISDPTWSWSANHHGRRPDPIIKPAMISRFYKQKSTKQFSNHSSQFVLRACPRQDRTGVTHAITPISFKLSQFMRIDKLFKNPK